MKKKFLLLPALFATISLCACNLNFTNPVTSELPTGMASEVASTSEITSEIASDSGWEKPSVQEHASGEKPGKETVSAEYDFDAHNPNEWQIAYRDFLKNLAEGKGIDSQTPSYETLYYFLADVEDRYSQYDPELCIKTGTCEADYQLLIYDYNPKTGKVEELVGKDQIYAGHSTFYVGPDGNLYSYAGHMGYLWVMKYTGLADGKVKSETIYEEDINQDPEAEYTTMTEIIGDEMEPVMSAPITNPAALIWYLNIPVATTNGNNDEADEAITRALYDNAEVYLVGSDEYYDGKTGFIPFHDIKKPGMLDSYSDKEFVLNVYCYTDVNFDGQDEMLIRLATDEMDEGGRYYFSYVLLSYQDGVVYAYAFPHIVYNDQFLDVCAYDVYHNWHHPEYDNFYGFIFDKDACILTYSDYKSDEKPENAKANVWKTFRVDFGY